MIVDGHLHVFRPASVVPRVVEELVPAERDAPVEDLLQVQAAHGVGGAVLVPLHTEDSYVARVMADHPGRFAAVAVAGAAALGQVPGTDPVAELRRRRDGLPFGALRTAWLGDPDRPLRDSPAFPVLRHLAENGLVLWSVLTSDQWGLLEQLAVELPDLTVVLNHLGLCSENMEVDRYRRPYFAHPNVPADRVVALAAHRQLHVMVSGQYALSRRPPPYDDLIPVVRRIADAYGAQRMLWASDYPWIRDVPGYGETLALPGQMLADASGAELAAITGGTVRSLFPGCFPTTGEESR